MAGDRPGAEALSGLARAFFYAGARALLVTHWPVASAQSAQFTMTVFDVLKDNPGLGRAEALRRTMLAFLADPSLPPYYAYPAAGCASPIKGGLICGCNWPPPAGPFFARRPPRWPQAKRLSM
jgi:CHAT domain